MTSIERRPRNVKVTVELEIHVPDATAEGVSVDDRTYEAAESAVADAFNAGDPDDVMNAVLIVESVEMLGSPDA